jgi:hypothetical protein
VGTGCSIHIAHSYTVKASRHRRSHRLTFYKQANQRGSRPRTPLVLPPQLR